PAICAPGTSGVLLMSQPSVPAGAPAIEALESRVMFAVIPSGFTETQVAAGFANPTSMTLAPDGRIFVAEQGGALRVVKNGSLLSTPFLQVNVNTQGERGLVGVEVDPNFATNKYVYVFYTATTPVIHNRVSRFTANGDVAL